MDETDQPDANNMTLREVLTDIIIPRLEAMDQKIDTRMLSFDRWRSRINGIFAVAIPLVIAGGATVFFH